METRHGHTVPATVPFYPFVKDKVEALAQQQLVSDHSQQINSMLKQNLENMEKDMLLKKMKHKLHTMQKFKSPLSTLEARDQVRKESLSTN
jgi:hypothetical protein